MIARSSGIALLLVLAVAGSAAAAERSSAFVRQRLTMGIPLALIVALWIAYVAWLGQRRREETRRRQAHRAAVQEKLGRILALLEERPGP